MTPAPRKKRGNHGTSVVTWCPRATHIDAGKGAVIGLKATLCTKFSFLQSCMKQDLLDHFDMGTRVDSLV